METPSKRLRSYSKLRENSMIVEKSNTASYRFSHDMPLVEGRNLIKSIKNLSSKNKDQLMNIPEFAS